MSATGVRRDKAALSSGCKPTRPIAPAGIAPSCRGRTGSGSCRRTRRTGSGLRPSETQKRPAYAADAYETKVRGEIVAGTHVPNSASITVAQAGELWLQRCRLDGLERSTCRQYSEHLRLHLSLIGTVKLSRLNRPMVEQFRDKLLETRSRAMARKVLTSLKGILSEAQRRRLVAQNVAAGTKVVMAKRHEEKAVIPSKEEIRAIVDKTAELWPPTLPWRPLVLTALFSGLRASELRGLTWDCVDFKGKLIRVRQRADYKNVMGSPKSAAGIRDVPIPPMVINTLRQWRLACPKSELNLVFTRTGNIILNSIIHRQCWRPLLQKVGLVDKETEAPCYRFHDLRHAAASLFIEQGWQAKKVQAIMGHSSIQMSFDLYGHLWKTLEDDAAAMNEIEKGLFS